MIEPVIDALTTVISPAWRAKNAMISSAMLPNVALRMPPTCGPVSAPRRSVERPTIQARPRIAAADTTNTAAPSTWSPKSSTIATTATGTSVTMTATRADERQGAEDRDAGGARLDSAGRARWAGRRGDRQVGHAGGLRLAVERAARDPRRGGHPARRLARGPRRPRRSASTSARAAVTARRRPSAAARPRRPPRPLAPARRRSRPRRGPGSCRRRACAGELAERPADDLSWSLVSSRHTAPGPVVAAGRGEVPERRGGPARAPRTGPLPRSSAAIAASRSRRSRPLRGRNPSNDQRGPATPTRRPRPAPTTPPAPGRPCRPAAAHAATSPSPGSETTGVPASVTSARSAPDRQVLQQLALAARPAPGVVARRAGRDLVAVEQPPRDPRVLGGDQRDGPQDLERPERDVAEVPDRRRDDVQRPARARLARPGHATTGPPSPAAGADTGSRRPPSAARASRSAGPGA